LEGTRSGSILVAPADRWRAIRRSKCAQHRGWRLRRATDRPWSSPLRPPARTGVGRHLGRVPLTGTNVPSVRRSGNNDRKTWCPHATLHGAAGQIEELCACSCLTTQPWGTSRDRCRRRMQEAGAWAHYPPSVAVVVPGCYEASVDQGARRTRCYGSCASIWMELCGEWRHARPLNERLPRSRSPNGISITPIAVWH